MPLQLPPDLDEFVRDEVKAGRYADEADVIRDAVRQLAEKREAAETAQLAALRAALAPGLADAKAGRFVEGGAKASAMRAAVE